MTPEERQAFTEKQRTFWQDEGVLLTISANARGESGTVFASNGSPRTGDPTKNMPSVAITAENYNRIARLLEHNVPVKLSFDIKMQFDTTQDHRVQRDRRNSRRHQAERVGDGGRPLRFLAHGHRRHR